MNKKVIILVILAIFILLIFLLVYRNLKSKNVENENIGNSEVELNETTFKDSLGEKYTVKYNEASLVYEIYDENGNLLVTSPKESGVKEYIKNPELVRAVN